MRSGMRCSARCCTSAPPPAARAQLHRQVGAALERERSAGAPVAAAELAMHFDRGAAADDRAALLRRGSGGRAAALQPGRVHGIDRARTGLGPAAAAGAERDALEITIATLQGVCAGHLLGVGSGQAKAAFGRAYALLSVIPGPRCGTPAARLRLTLSLRGEYARHWRWRSVRERSLRPRTIRLLMLGACIVQGEVHICRAGRGRRGWIERGLGVSSRSTCTRTTVCRRPQVTLHGLLGIQLLHRGRVELTRRLQRARERADRWASR